MDREDVADIQTRLCAAAGRIRVGEAQQSDADLLMEACDEIEYLRDEIKQAFHARAEIASRILEQGTRDLQGLGDR